MSKRRQASVELHASSTPLLVRMIQRTASVAALSPSRLIVARHENETREYSGTAALALLQFQTAASDGPAFEDAAAAINSEILCCTVYFESEGIFLSK